MNLLDYLLVGAYVVFLVGMGGLLPGRCSLLRLVAGETDFLNPFFPQAQNSLRGDQKIM